MQYNGNEILLYTSSLLISQTDKNGVILYANEDFCEIAGYSNSEIIGKPHNIIRHPDMPKSAFKDMWNTIQSGKIWTGFVKNLAKSRKFYWVYATVFSYKDGYLSVRRMASRDEIAKFEKEYKELRGRE